MLFVELPSVLPLLYYLYQNYYCFGPIKLPIFTFGIEQILPEDNLHPQWTYWYVYIVHQEKSFDVLNTAYYRLFTQLFFEFSSYFIICTLDYEKYLTSKQSLTYLLHF